MTQGRIYIVHLISFSANGEPDEPVCHSKSFIKTEPAENQFVVFVSEWVSCGAVLSVVCSAPSP